MKARRLALAVTLTLVAMLILSGTVAAGSRRVYPFKAHLVSLVDYGTQTYSPLPGGRTLSSGESLKICYVADEVVPGYDFISGCWTCHTTSIYEPGGALKTWGSCSEQELDYVQDGGWIHTTWGVWSPEAKIISLHAKAVGWGSLEGWTMEWREFAVNYVDEVDFGHLTAPK